MTSPRRLALLFLVSAVRLAAADIARPFDEFVQLRRVEGILHEPRWDDIRANPALFRGRTIGYLLLVRGRIDATGETRLIGYSRADELVEVVTADGCSVGLPGQWLAVLGIIPDSGPVTQLVGTAVTRIAAPERPRPPQAAPAVPHDNGGANGVPTVQGGAAPTTPSVPPGPAPGGPLPSLPAMGGDAPDGVPPQAGGPVAPQDPPQQPRPAAPGFDAGAQGRLEWFIYQRNKRVPETERTAIAAAILRLSAAYRMRWEFFAALICSESNFNRRAVSSAGAVGLGQLMPFNVRAYGIRDPYDIEQNLRGAAMHIRRELDRYAGRAATDQFQLALAAYNAGPGAVSKFGGVPPYRETIAYIRRVAGYYTTLCAQSAQAVGG